LSDPVALLSGELLAAGWARVVAQGLHARGFAAPGAGEWAADPSQPGV
jgi:hypothetical protein